MRLTSPLLARQEGSGVQTKPAMRSFIAISSLLCSGFLDPSDVLKECLKMKAFIHPHVMGILGICLADQAPYIVMPFMANGSLHSYLRKHRADLLISEDEDVDLVLYDHFLNTPRHRTVNWYCNTHIHSLNTAK